ncbi:siderophore-interacting protein [Corynebacterium glutamicum]|uniref:siderophore-interacting protein n=1 Tax=Corynebacterium glutamicum TaxID=1718 RepID=UPI001F527A76|nr:siderophore-interacting protein [Corynebacterium glutamicum]
MTSTHSSSKTPTTVDHSSCPQTGETHEETDNLLRENSHDRDISEIIATITALDHPSPSFLRFTAFVPGSANNPVWAEANVAIRLYLSEEFDDATRVYTVRSFDAATESIVVDVVQHHHESP